MSTRAAIHFEDSRGKAHAIVYRHSDGYPEGLGKDIDEFVTEVRSYVIDNRFNDPSYLAAKWVVWDCKRYVEGLSKMGLRSGHYLDFLGCGILLDDPFDIAYRYHVVCDGKPTVRWDEV